MRHYRFILRTVTFLIILQGAAMVLFYGWCLQHKCSSVTESNNKVHVLVLTSWRSGSSFLGQVFGQHPSVFYLMEPGWHVWTQLRVGARKTRMAVRDLLRSLFQCDFSVMESYLEQTSHISNLFFWSHSRALCSPPACSLTPRNQISNQTECLKVCGTQGLEGAQDACSTYSHVVLKEVRFFELESLYPLLQDPSLDLRIIHLVRDPRAVVRSRELVFGNFLADNDMVLDKRFVPAKEVDYEIMQKICSSHVRITDRALVNPPPFLEGRYKLVRYEDVVINPLEEINALYEFVGLGMTSTLADWIYRVTHGKSKGSQNEAFQITSRSAADVSQAWRTTLPYNKVKRIQDVCKPAMTLLGYRTVNSEKDQKNLDLDLLVPQEPYQLVTSKNREPQ
ncbi:carbohydrate sulfotransferase 5-like [Thalassophryne amazonica]|uniref:carbohydrate sulfotransferase 5-like n=1 Tax=Thalassophryne amazonica TaxID=390379 RepID=UPI0014709C4B|nr:carbohydrate sulfotransferase 5-like [Thalassophryne amazonica]